MLVYTFFVTARFFSRYCFQKILVVELRSGVETLKSIAAAAPFLGLAGTCYGILGGFHGIAMERSSALGMMVTTTAASLVTTVAGLVVAVPAAVSYNVLRTLLEKVERKRSNPLFDAMSRAYGLAQTLPLRRRFARLPVFALIAAPVLAILIPMYALVDTRIATGLPVHLLKTGAYDDHNFSPVIVTVIGTGARDPSVVFVNSKATSWNELGNALRAQLEVQPRWIVYVAGGDDVAWQDVANAIDVARGLRAEVVLLPATPNIESSQARGAKTKKARGR
jgi:hypothetical protein